MATSWLLLPILALAAAIIYFGFRAIRRRELAEIKRFEQSTPTEDLDFVTALGVSEGSSDARKVTAIRAGIAELGEVPPHSIRADHRFYPDLERLPFYDSIDFLGLILMVEEKLDVRLGDTDHEMLSKIVTEGTVMDFVLNVLRSHQDDKK